LSLLSLSLENPEKVYGDKMTDNTMNDEVMSNNTSDEEAAVAGIFDARKEKRFTWSNVTMTVVRYQLCFIELF